MSVQSGLAIEAEEIGMVALIGLILTPGVMWVANGKSITSKIIRGVVIGALVTGAVVLEASMDKVADNVAA